MSGFTRRYGYFPGLDVVTQIEGIIIIDEQAGGVSAGVSTGVACCVGEFADMTYATAVDGSGNVTTFCEPQEVFTPQDVFNKFGGWDETIGEFGVSGGNGFVSLRNKSYSRLIIAPVNLASAKGTRYVRQLPLCTTQTNTMPVVPAAGGTINAGREFKSAGGGRVRIGARVNFTSFEPIAVGTLGSTTNVASAATQNFTVAGADFSQIVRPDGTLGIKKGDILVIGNNNAGAFQPLPAGGNLGAGTYRVQADAASGSPTILVVETLTGGNFAFVTATNIPWRIHVGSDADSAPTIVVGATVPGGYALADVGGYSTPTRPLTNNTGSLVDGTIPAASLLTPLVAPPAMTGSSWDTLSGLTGVVMPGGGGGLDYVAAVQAPNAAANATLDALYSAAFDATIDDATPMSEINIIWSARTSANIRSKGKQNELAAYGVLAGRFFISRPPLSVQDTASAIADTDPGVGANRDEATLYTWPGNRTFIPEAVNFKIKTANGLTTLDGILDVGSDALLASVLSNLPPENNPGQGAPPVPSLMSAVLGIQRGVGKLGIGDYTALKRRGVCALRMDRVVGPVFQSGVTTSLIKGQSEINRRHFAFFIEDSLADALKPYAKLPLTDAMRDNSDGACEDFMTTLLSPQNKAQARILDFSVDGTSGNSPETDALNVHVIIVKAKMIPLGNFIVVQVEVGNDVVVTKAING